MSRKREEEVQVFKFKESNIGVIDRDGEPWFVARDLCRSLELQNTSKAVKSLDKDEKDYSLIYSKGGDQRTIIVNSAGLFHLVSKSRSKPSKAYQKWLRSVVLPNLGILTDEGLSTKSMSQAEVSLMHAKILVDHEREIRGLSSKVDENNKEIHEVKKRIEDMFEDSGSRTNRKKSDLLN